MDTLKERRKRLMFVLLRGSAMRVAEEAQSAERSRRVADRQTDGSMDGGKGR